MNFWIPPAQRTLPQKNHLLCLHWFITEVQLISHTIQSGNASRYIMTGTSGERWFQILVLPAKKKMSVLSVNNRHRVVTAAWLYAYRPIVFSVIQYFKLCYLCCVHCWERWPEVFIDFVEALCIELVLNVPFVLGLIFFKCGLAFKRLKGDCQSWSCFLHEPVLNEPLHVLYLCRKLDWVCTV